MESKMKIFGHAAHPILVVFPLGLFATAVVFDAIGWATGNGRWLESSFRIIAVGIIGGLISALFGLIDFQAIPWDTRAKRIGIWHGLGNVAVIFLFGASWLIRWQRPANPGTLPVMLSLAGGLGGLVLAAWINALVSAMKFPSDLPLIIDLRVDWRVLAFAFGVSLATGIAFGMLPALQASRPELVPALKDEKSMGGFRRSRLRMRS